MVSGILTVIMLLHSGHVAFPSSWFKNNMHWWTVLWIFTQPSLIIFVFINFSKRHYIIIPLLSIKVNTNLFSMGYTLGEQSKAKLKGVRPELVKVIELAITKSDQDFTVHEGLRSVERQKMLVETGKSQTMNSRHITGDAVDLWVLVDGKVTWDMKCYKKLAAVVLDCAKELEVDVEWGGAWKFKDGPHFQLSWKTYP